MKIIQGFWIVIFCVVSSGAQYDLYDWITEDENFSLTDDDYESVPHYSIFNESTACEGHSQLIDNETVIIESPGYPEPYPTNHDLTNCSAWFWVITTTAYNIDIMLEKFNICAICNDTVVISPGVTMQKDSASVFFTGSVSQHRQVQVLEHSSVYILFITQNRTDNDYEGFRLIIEGNGTIPTTEPPTTMSPPPSTLPPDIPTNIAVYLYGKHPEDFLAVMTSFQTAVANMANTYCTSMNIQLSSKIIYSDVQILVVQQCPTTWPEWDICTAVTMAVPVNLANNSDNTYELTTAHLQEMWNMLAQNNSLLISLGLKVYEVPKEDQALFVWLSLSLGIVVMFMIILFAGWMLLMHIHNRASNFNKQEGNTKISIASADSWVSDNTYQQVPPFTEPYQEMEPTETLEPSILAVPRVSEGEFGGALHFSPLKGYDNEAYDNTTEFEQTKSKGQNHEHDFSSDEEIDTTKTVGRINDHLYEDPNSQINEDKESESVL